MTEEAKARALPDGFEVLLSAAGESAAAEPWTEEPVQEARRRELDGGL